MNRIAIYIFIGIFFSSCYSSKSFSISGSYKSKSVLAYGDFGQTIPERLVMGKLILKCDGTAIEIIKEKRKNGKLYFYEEKVGRYYVNTDTTELSLDMGDDMIEHFRIQVSEDRRIVSLSKDSTLIYERHKSDRCRERVRF